MIIMVVKKQEKKETSKEVVQKEPAKFGLEEIADYAAVSVFKMKSYFQIAGIPQDAKISLNEVEKKIKNLL